MPHLIEVPPRPSALENRHGQLALALEDANAVHHIAAAAGWRGYATLNHRVRPDAPLREFVFPIESMAFVISEALREKGASHDLFIAQHAYSRGERTTPALRSLNVAHIDLDIYNTSWIEHDKRAVVEAVLRRLDQWGVPYPSYAVDSGRGLQLKWVWTEPLPAAALPRWQVAHRYIVEEILSDFAADIKATLPTQIMRLVGSVNWKNERAVEVIWVNGGDPTRLVTIPFDAWAKAVLPYSRDEVKEFRARMEQYGLWDIENKTNLAKKLDEMPSTLRPRQRQEAWKQVAKAIGMDMSPASLASIDDLTAGEIWQRRLGVMERLVKVRGYEHGIPVGDRHTWIWIAGNAMGWVNRGNARPLKADIVGWAKQFAPSYTASEAVQAASAVLGRAKQQRGYGAGLYRMKETTFADHLGITEAEREALNLQARQERPEDQWAIGAMELEPIRGLSFDEYKAEVRARQRASAERTNLMARSANAPLREEARKLRAGKMSQAEIARRLGVNQSTVHRWIKS